mmetsp:Transcript_18135/g.41953  ORF Transcript_18135/g.41953 Transcript_18135/m.41953 type:complete len:200 (+) Transcript_18135:250-849(+)
MSRGFMNHGCFGISCTRFGMSRYNRTVVAYSRNHDPTTAAPHNGTSSSICRIGTWYNGGSSPTLIVVWMVTESIECHKFGYHDQNHQGHGPREYEQSDSHESSIRRTTSQYDQDGYRNENDLHLRRNGRKDPRRFGIRFVDILCLPCHTNHQECDGPQQEKGGYQPPNIMIGNANTGRFTRLGIQFSSNVFGTLQCGPK